MLLFPAVESSATEKARGFWGGGGLGGGAVLFGRLDGRSVEEKSNRTFPFGARWNCLFSFPFKRAGRPFSNWRHLSSREVAFSPAVGFPLGGESKGGPPAG